MAIHFLGERPMLITGAKSCFNVADADPFLKRHEASGKGSSRITLHKKPSRTNSTKHAGKSFENSRRELQGSLILLHEIQVVVRRDVEHAEHLIEHVAMLR